MPNTRPHATMRSRSPSTRCRLPRIASPVRRAASWACSTVSSRPTLPSGRLIDPSASCGPCPEMIARVPITRTNWNGSDTPAGAFSGGGSTKPREASRSSIKDMVFSGCWRSGEAPVEHGRDGGRYSENQQEDRQLFARRVAGAGDADPHVEAGDREPGQQEDRGRGSVARRVGRRELPTEHEQRRQQQKAGEQEPGGAHGGDPSIDRLRSPPDSV